jgi:hypothetical protein
MPNEVKITVYWGLEKGRTFVLNCERSCGWRITNRDDVQLLSIREEGGMRHEIPLTGVQHWSVDASALSDDEHKDDSKNETQFESFYCLSCSEQFVSWGGGLGPHYRHNVRHLCCGAAYYNENHATCPKRE